MGDNRLMKFQAGKETTRGTPVATNTVLLGQVGELTPDRKPTFPDEHIGLRAQSMRSIVHQYQVKDTFKCANAYYQLLPLLLGCGLKGGVTPTETTPGQADYAWNQSPSLTAANSPNSMTVQKGDDTQVYQADYAMIERLRLSWQVSQGMEASPVALEADFFARHWTPISAFDTVALPTVEDINGKFSRFYLNTAWASVGTTEKTNILRGGDIEFLTGVMPDYSGSASKDFNTHVESNPEAMAQFTFTGGSDADAIWDAFQAQTFQVIRVAFLGSQLGSGAVHSLKIDIGGYWEDVRPIGAQENGQNLHKAVFHGVYDVTGAKKFQVNTVTNVASY